MKVRNVESSRGNDVPNQFIIEGNGTHYFQSYNSIIAQVHKGQVTLDKEKWDYSATTGKYRNQFLGETKQETKKKIANGEYKLANLNKSRG